MDGSDQPAARVPCESRVYEMSREGIWKLRQRVWLWLGARLDTGFFFLATLADPTSLGLALARSRPGIFRSRPACQLPP